MKLDKGIVQRRIDLMEKCGVKFRAGVEVGVDVDTQELLAENDAVMICVGATIPRDLPIENRDLVCIVSYLL
eukprot:SAG31_NODE_2485_length_5624_cov_2.110206_8_plen_72_part_00